ncbi:MAG: hypothetical protein JXJ22_16345 [Bacteroidales bacterium]|nr:hypothetical protein [Bacteroidales bacterium]
MFFFVTDLHGKKDRYKKLFQKILEEKPAAVFLGGDLLPSGLKTLLHGDSENFVQDFLIEQFTLIKRKLAGKYPRVFVILGNDDSLAEEEAFIEAELKGIWDYMHNKKIVFGKYSIYGYSCVPPTPFLFKDWERYDISRYVDPGCVPPEEGYHSYPFNEDEVIYNTIQNDIDLLVANDDLSAAIFLFHSPPYQTKLDRAALDNMMFNHVPLDVNTGSIAIKNFIELKQPLISLHGHIHESARLTGSWKDTINNTFLFSAAHDGPELALVRFDPENRKEATRELI